MLTSVVVAPTFIAVVQMWYRRREQTLRNACWYSMLGVVNMVSIPPIPNQQTNFILTASSKLGSLLAYGLGHIKSPLRPYQVIFLFCGAITVGFSVVML